MTDYRKVRTLPDFQYRGARSSVALHAEQLGLFLEVWKKAKAAGVVLPADKDPDYASLEALLKHVFRWSRTYMVWMCEQLGMPDPDIDPVPDVGSIESEADRFLGMVLKAWKAPLSDIPENRFFKEIFTSPWGVPYCVDAMLEHAVMHPVKHRFQLEELMGER